MRRFFQISKFQVEFSAPRCTFTVPAKSPERGSLAGMRANLPTNQCFTEMPDGPDGLEGTPILIYQDFILLKNS